MIGALLALALLLPLHGCGVLFPYIYDAQTLQDRLTVSMPKDQVLKRLGKPDRVVQEQGSQTIWEYRFYPKGEWAAYLIHCPFFPHCYFPAEAGNPYYVVLQDNRLCIWGTPEVVHPLIERVCGGAQPGQRDSAGWGVRIAVTPLFMPPPITPLPQRLAVVPVNGAVGSEINSWLDFTLNFLRQRHRDLVLVEREDLRRLLREIGIQYGGHVDDETAIGLGRMVGADSLLTYRLIQPEDDAGSAAFELRLFKIENGTTLFRQMALAQPTSPDARVGGPARSSRPSSSGPRVAMTKAAAYGLASLMAAFGDNPLGLVPDYKSSGEGIRVTDVLQGGPGFLAGLKAGDRIVASNGIPVGHWFEAISFPARLTVARNGQSLEMEVR